MTSVAVVGYGYWGSKHVRVLSAIPGTDVTVVDSRPERLAAARADFPVARVCDSLDEALGSVDAVVVATPVRTHAPLGLRALAAGAHVLIEKPLAASSNDALELIAAAKRSDRVLMVGHTFEYNAALRRLRELIDEGVLGDVYYIDSARLNLGLYQSDVSVLWDLAPHDVSIANYLLRSTPTEVSAWGRAHAGSFIDVAYVQLQYRNPDVSAYVHISWLDPSKVRRVTVAGSAKMAIYDDMAVDERLRIHDKGVGTAPGGDAPGFPLVYRYGDILSPYVAFEEPLAVEDRHFIDCVRGFAACATPGESGLDVVRVLEAADRSILEGHGVAVEVQAPVESRAVAV